MRAGRVCQDVSLSMVSMLVRDGVVAVVSFVSTLAGEIHVRSVAVASSLWIVCFCSGLVGGMTMVWSSSCSSVVFTFF